MKTAVPMPDYAQRSLPTLRFSLRTFCSLVTGLALAAVSAGMPAAAQTVPPIVLPWSMSTIAGTGSNGNTGNGGAATAAEISNDLRAIAVDGQGNIYFTDTGNSLIRKINAATGVITVVAGGSTVCATAVDKEGDGCLAATQTLLSTPRGLALDNAGNLYIAGYNDSLVHKINFQTGLMTLVAGAAAAKSSGTKSFTGDGTQATSAAVNSPRGVRVDNFGNIWICDTGNNVIREINARTGVITTVVGSDASAPSAATPGSPTATDGDGSVASSSSVLLNAPTDIIFDSKNNAYIVDFNDKRIREVNASTGIITTIIGNGGTAAVTAPAWPAPALSVALGSPTKIAIDSNGNLYVADSGSSVVYFYDAVAKTITPIAGEYGYAGVSTGFPVCASNTDSLGDGCPATQAVFYDGTSALGVALDGQNNLYITDPFDVLIRKVSTNLSFPATMTTGTATQTVDLHFTAADTPAATNGIVVGASLGDYTIASAPSCTTNSDTTTNCTLGVTFAPLYPGLRGAPLTVTSLASHQSFALTGVGNGALASYDPGTIATVGSGLSSSHGAAFDAAGNLYIADTGNHRVVEINAITSAQTVIAGTGTSGYSGDGALATSATLKAPAAVAVSPSGEIYIADTGNNAVRAIDPVTGFITTFAGGGTACTENNIFTDAQGDGCPATQATLSSPSGLTLDTAGNLYIADTGNNSIRRVDHATGTINLDAGTATGATFSGPTGLASDSMGDIFVADTGDNLIRKISLGAGSVTTVAGNGQSVFTGDGGLATSASLDAPTAVTLDAAGDLYIADTGNDVVRLVAAGTGNISTLLGQGAVPGATGGTGAASELELKSPGGIALTAMGNLALVDTANSRAVLDNRNAGLLAFGNGNTGSTSTEQTASVISIGNQTLTFTNSPAYTASGSTTQFTIDTSAATFCPGAGSLGAGTDCTIAAAFNPSTTGAQSDVLTFPGNAVNAATASLDLTGTGVQLVTTNVTLTLTTPASGSIAYGQSATFTAVVAPTSGPGIPTGSVTFSVDGKPQPAVTLSATDTATLSEPLLTVGTHTISALYSGDAVYASSHATLTEPVSQAATRTTLTISPTTQIQLQPVTLTAQVTSLTTGIPTGSVTFISGGTAIGTAATLNASGQATLTTTSLAIASYSVTAVYSGDPNYSTSTSSAVALTINPIPPGFAIATSNLTLSVPQGGTVQTAFTLTPQGGITGTVSFACSGLPANTTCTFYPTLTLPGTAAETTSSTAASPLCAPAAPQACTVLTITTNTQAFAVASTAPEAMGPSQVGSKLLPAFALLPALLLLLGGKQRRRLHGRRLLLLLGVSVLTGLTLLSGCASNVTQSAILPTPVGTSTVTVTMSGPDSVTATQAITLTVVQGTAIIAERNAGAPHLASEMWASRPAPTPGAPHLASEMWASRPAPAPGAPHLASEMWASRPAPTPGAPHLASEMWGLSTATHAGCPHISPLRCGASRPAPTPGAPHLASEMWASRPAPAPGAPHLASEMWASRPAPTPGAPHLASEMWGLSTATRAGCPTSRL